jgi:hypothetical protein
LGDQLNRFAELAYFNWARKIKNKYDRIQASEISGFTYGRQKFTNH